MTVYVVIKVAVYRHGIIGVFDDLARATEIARDAALASDGHHDFEVIPYELNERYADKDVKGGPAQREPDSIASINRRDIANRPVSDSFGKPGANA